MRNLFCDDVETEGKTSPVAVLQLPVGTKEELGVYKRHYGFKHGFVVGRR